MTVWRFARCGVFAAFAFGACGGETAVPGPVSRTVAGDTIIVRWSGPGEWGDIVATEELRIGQLDGAVEYTFGRIAGMDVDAAGSVYIVDGHARQIRVFGADGRHLRSFAREGSGPGEIRNPTGLRLLADGRVLVRDFGNRRYNLYTHDGEPLSVINIPGHYATPAPFFIDEDGLLCNPMNRAQLGEPWQDGLERFRLDGTVVDTIAPPWVVERIALLAKGERGRVTYSLPNAPDDVWTYSPRGYLVGGVNNAYAIHSLLNDSTVLRVERAVPPVMLAAGEKAQLEQRVTNSLRSIDPSWQWNGPPVPDTKPWFTRLLADDDGRIWVKVSRPSVPEPVDPAELADARSDAPRERWVEPNVHDIYSAEGDLLGSIELPKRFDLHVARGDRIWGVIRDDDDVQYVVRMRIAPD